MVISWTEDPVKLIKDSKVFRNPLSDFYLNFFTLDLDMIIHAAEAATATADSNE